MRIKAVLWASLILNVAALIAPLWIVHRLGGWSYFISRMGSQRQEIAWDRQWFEKQPESSATIVFAGDSITQRMLDDTRRHGMEGDLPEPWARLVKSGQLRDRSIGGDKLADMLPHFDTITKLHPQKVFLMFGVNDLAGGASPQSIADNISQAISLIHKADPSTEVYVQSILPIRVPRWEMTNDRIVETNQAIAKTCKRSGAIYIDLHGRFLGEDGKMKAAFTDDGLHPYGDAFIFWRQAIASYLMP